MPAHFPSPSRMPASRRFACLLLPLGLLLAQPASAGATDYFDYATVGVWAGAPLGASAEAGLALPLKRERSGSLHAVAGAEIGTGGSKSFIGLREIFAAHGVAWGSLHLARWDTGKNAVIARPERTYWGVEASFIILRAAIMIPDAASRAKGADPTVGLAVGLGF